MAFMHSTIAVDSSGWDENAVANRKVLLCGNAAVSDAAWNGNSTDPFRSAFSTFCLDGVNHLGINETPYAKNFRSANSACCMAWYFCDRTWLQTGCATVHALALQTQLLI